MELATTLSLSRRNLILCGMASAGMLVLPAPDAPGAALPDTPSYSPDSIQVLKFPDVVRKRPDMFIGEPSDGSGLHQMIYEVAENAISEAFYSPASEVMVTLNGDRSCTVTDNGLGIRDCDTCPEQEIFQVRGGLQWARRRGC